MELQQIFDSILTGLREQGRASVTYVHDEDHDGVHKECQYRGDGGAKCAAGLIIKDEHYDSEFEGQSALDGDARAALVKSGVPNTDRNFELIRDCQFAHDSQLAEISLQAWEVKMAAIADEYGLTYTAPSEAL